jgi:hypothetical protein
VHGKFGKYSKYADVCSLNVNTFLEGAPMHSLSPTFRARNAVVAHRSHKEAHKNLFAPSVLVIATLQATGVPSTTQLEFLKVQLREICHNA